MKVVVCIKAPEKTVYRTENEANADLRRGKYGGCNKPPVRAYHCLRHWHLTSQENPTEDSGYATRYSRSRSVAETYE